MSEEAEKSGVPDNLHLEAADDSALPYYEEASFMQASIFGAKTG